MVGVQTMIQFSSTLLEFSKSSYVQIYNTIFEELLLVLVE